MNKVVYIHRRKDNNSIFYVGMGFLDRSKDKINRSKEWKEISKDGYNIDVVAKDLTRKDAVELESFIIDEIGLENLVNKSNGGEGGHISYNNKTVFQYDLDGKFINKHISIAEAGRKTNVISKNISKCLSGEREYAGGFIWSSKKKKMKPKKMKYNRHKLILDTSNGVFYESLPEYCDLNKLNKSTVSRWLNGVRENKSNLKYV